MSRHFRFCSRTIPLSRRLPGLSLPGLLLGVSLISGCGSSDAPPPVAQAPATAPEEESLSGGDTESSEPEADNSAASNNSNSGASYGDENYSGNSGGGNSGNRPGGSSGGMMSPGGSSGGMNSPGGSSGGMFSGDEDGLSMEDGASSTGGESGNIPGGMPGLPPSGRMPNMSSAGGSSGGMSGRMPNMSSSPGGSSGGMSAGMPAMSSGGSDMMAPGMPDGGGPGGGFGGFGNPGTSATPTFEMLAAFANQNCVQCHSDSNPKADFSIAALSENFAADGEGWKEFAAQLGSGAMPPPNTQRRFDSTQQAMIVNYIEGQLAENDSGDVGYLARAKQYFGSGREKDAIKYLYAHTLVADDEAAADLLSQSRWFSLGRHPAATIRFAAGVVLTAPSTITDLKPIGTSQFGNGSGGGGGMGMGIGDMGSMRRSGGAQNATEGTERNFNDLTGEIGQALASSFESRWSSGSLGTVFSDVALDEKSARTVGSLAGRGGGGGGMGSGRMPGMSSSGGGMGMDMGSGMGMDMGMGPGGMEGDLGGGGFGGGPAGMGGAVGGGAAPSKIVKAGQNITPGLVYLGTGSQQELLKKAEEAGVDGLFLFDVKVSQNIRNKIVTNDTKVRLLINGETTATSSSLVNTEVERAALRGTGGDEVTKSIDKLFARFDSEVQLTELPALKPEHAKSRIHQLVNDEASNPLTTLYETRLFNSKGLISQAEMETVFQIVLRGNEGIALASGSAADRMMVMKDFLKKE